MFSVDRVGRMLLARLGNGFAMKRSSLVRLTLLAAVSTVILTGCDNPPDEDQVSIASAHPDEIGTLYKDAAACEKNFSKQECQEREKEALALHDQSAPRYLSEEACRTQHNECVVRRNDDGSSSFMPMMMGYLIGRNSAQNVYYGPPPNCSSQPYGSCDSDRRTTTGGAYVYGGRSGFVGETPSGTSSTVVASPGSTVARGAFSAPSVSSVARGGFGSTASAHMGGGS